MRIDKRMLEDIPAWLARQDDIPGGWLYIGDEKERYLLGQPGRRNMLVFGVNPSTASAGENNLDPTIKRVRKFVQKDPTCDGWIMANLYPLRATDPDDLPAKADKKLIEKNLKVLEALQKSYFIDKVWAAWGDLIDSRDYLGNTLYDIQDTIKEAEWYHLGTTTRWGNPRHPLYLKGDSEFQWFPVFDYACECRDGDIW